MNVKELYEKQYSQKKLVSPVSYPLLRKIFRKLDLSREDLALSFLDNFPSQLLLIMIGKKLVGMGDTCTTLQRKRFVTSSRAADLRY